MSQFTVGAGRESVTVIVDRWLSQPSGPYALGRAEVRAGGFSGEFDLWLESADIARFLAELGLMYSKLSGEARLWNLEGQLDLRFAVDGQGHVLVRGSAKDRLPGNTLQFSLDIDQSYLPTLLAELQAMVSDAASTRPSQ